MNNVVACTITEVATNLSCVIRIYKDNKPTWNRMGDWDWLGGIFKFTKVYSGIWFLPPVREKESIKLNLCREDGGVYFECDLYDVPVNFLDTRPGHPLRGKGSLRTTSVEINWSIWYRTASINEGLG